MSQCSQTLPTRTDELGRAYGAPQISDDRRPRVRTISYDVDPLTGQVMPHYTRSRNGRASASSPAVASSLFEPLDFVMVRTPLLPVENYLSLGSSSGSSEANGRPAEQVEAFLTCDPAVRRALAVGSSTLLSEMDRKVPAG